MQYPQSAPPDTVIKTKEQKKQRNKKRQRNKQTKQRNKETNKNKRQIDKPTQMKTMANKPNDKATHKQRESGKRKVQDQFDKKESEKTSTHWRHWGQQICMA